MPRTNIKGSQVKDSDIKEVDIGDEAVTRNKLNTSTTGHAVVRKVTASDGVMSISNGVDAGTGDVVIKGNSNWTQTQSKIYKYYIKATPSQNVQYLPNQDNLVQIDSILYEYDEAQQRYNSLATNLLVKTDELWLFNLTIMARGNAGGNVGRWGIWIYNSDTAQVIASNSSEGQNTRESLQINTLFLAQVDSNIQVYVYSLDRMDIVLDDVFGHGNATQFNMNRIR